MKILELQTPSSAQIAASSDLRPVWIDDKRCIVDGVEFVLSTDIDTHNSQSAQDKFLLGKHRRVVEDIFALGTQENIKRIVDIGIFKGGSMALYALIFAPEKLVGIEYSTTPQESLERFITNRGLRNHVRSYYGTSQADTERIREIIKNEFPDAALDLVVDDASHLYVETRASFEMWFPLLRPGGIYIIENWGWGHWRGDLWQKSQIFPTEMPSLTNLLIEISILCASRPDLVANVQIEPSVIKVRRGCSVFEGDILKLDEVYLNRDKAFSATTTQSANRSPEPRLIAFYLPQFHPIPENDLWWGKGFTEWTNVTKAEPLFEGHLQPHLPTDFGFYDLRLRETRREQIKVAKQYGVDGFCYHYYWFSGKRILNRPLDDMLADPDSDMPFCLCWANENWTRRWDGADQEILIAQQYLPDDDLNFIKSLVPFFQDKRYIRVDGKPYLIVYRPQHLPDPAKTAAIWREYCRSVGLGEIHICAALTHGNEDYTLFEFDSGVEFPPHNLKIANINDQLEFHEIFIGNLMQFASVAQFYLDRVYGNARVFKTVFPSWDNTARTKERALIVLNGTPENYEYWLASTIDQVRQAGKANELVFINAWNEWAEGCHLEPDRRYGHRFLQATLKAKVGIRRFAAFPHVSVPDKIKMPTVDEEQELLRPPFWSEISSAIKYHLRLKIDDLKLMVNRKPWLRFLLLPFVRTVRTFRARI